MHSIFQPNRRTFLTRGTLAGAAFSLVGTSFKAAAARTSMFKAAPREPHSLAVGADGLVAIAGADEIVFHRADGSVARRIETSRPVTALAFDAGGRLHAAVGNQIARMGESGNLVLLGAPLDGEVAIVGLAIGADGRIFAADSAGRVVWRLDAEGAVLGRISTGKDGFKVSRAFFPVAWSGNALFVADPGRHQMHQYSPDGELLSKWGSHTRDAQGFSGCCNPVSLAAAPDGSVLTAERGQPRVKSFSGDGRLTRVLAGPEQFAAGESAARAGDVELPGCTDGVIDVATSPAGEVMVLDRTTGVVRVIA